MRKFLVVLDDSRECLNAMRFAAMRAAHTQAGVEILAVIPPEEFNHWIGVGDIMRQLGYERVRRRVYGDRKYVWVQAEPENVVPMNKPEVVVDNQNTNEN